MERMSSAERVAYAHGRIARDMQDFQRQIERTRQVMGRERNLWLALVALSTILLVVVFYFAGPNDLIDFALIGIVFVTFTTIRFVSYNMMKRQLSMLGNMQILYSRLADDETIGFVTETMKVEENGEAAKKRELIGLGAMDPKLHQELISAMRVLTALVVEIEKMQKDEHPDTPASVSEEADSG